MTDLRLGELDTVEDLRALTDLMAEVWGEAFLDVGIVRAIQYAGGYVAGAWDGTRLVGASLAFLGRHDHTLLLHSHATCSAPDQAGRGIGRRLKWHQRDWALARDISAVEWTYDPLVARNGWFNLVKLAARAVAYEVDFYGRMSTAIERGEESDRCVVRWDLADQRVLDAAAGVTSRPDVKTMHLSGTPVLLDVGGDGEPVPGDPDPGPDTALARITPDIERLRATDPAAAGRWRRAFRETVGRAMQAGHQLTAATRDGWYVLTPADELR